MAYSNRFSITSRHKQAAPPRRLMVIVNPISGTRPKIGLPTLIKSRLSRAGFDVDLRMTHRKGDATRLAREAVDRQYYGVLAVGGDGTVNETARALCNTAVALGIIPTGSGNGLARHMSIPMDVKAALRVIADRVVEACDYATVNGQPFFCTCGLGFDAAVTHRFANEGRRGLATYIKSTLAELKTYKEQNYRIAIDGYKSFEKEAFIVAVCNASQYGNNAYIAPMASITDGKLDVVIIHKGNPLSKVVVGVEMMTGTIRNSALIDTMQCRRVVIERDSGGEGHIDGEPVEFGARVEVEVHPGGLLIFTNGRKSRFMPLISAITRPAEELWNKIESKLGDLCGD